MSQNKLKAGVAAIISDNKELIQKAKQLYLSNQVIYSSSDEERVYRKDNVFYDFLAKDYRQRIEQLKECGDQEALDEIDKDLMSVQVLNIGDDIKKKMGLTLRSAKDKYHINNSQ